MNSKTVITPGRGRAKKYPKINYNYESVDNPGMFFAGTATHSLDFRKSAGGFIHGFRYTGENLGLFPSWCIISVWIDITKIDYKTKIDHVHNVYLCNLSKFELPWLELIMMFDRLSIKVYLDQFSFLIFALFHTFSVVYTVGRKILGGFRFFYFIDDISQ